MWSETKLFSSTLWLPKTLGYAAYGKFCTHFRTTFLKHCFVEVSYKILDENIKMAKHLVFSQYII